MADLVFSLHDKQLEVYNSPARFKVVAAGRQSGKTTLAGTVLTVGSLATESWGGVPLDTTFETAYIYPTFEAGKKNVWPRLKKIIDPIASACQVYENTGLIVFPNGRRLRLFGADNPDSLRGFTWSHVVLDEYKDMADNVWNEVVRPALSVARGTALFIGTPKGKNHFYYLYKMAEERHASGDPEWAAFTFTSAANPAISKKEILSMSKDMSKELVAQEIEAAFRSHGGKVFKEDHFQIDPCEPSQGTWVVAVDLAGFKMVGSSTSKMPERRDDHAIVVAKVTTEGWWVKQIDYGRWDVRETALRIFMAAKSVGTSRVGIEKGLAQQAVMPYLTDMMRQFNRWLEVVPLSHKNQAKYDRIQWALQGRAEKGRIMLNPGDWNAKLIEQACDFPDPKSHDDLLDALAYVDQMSTTVYLSEFDYEQKYEPVDPYSGY
jgi:hypothetical protein